MSTSWRTWVRVTRAGNRPGLRRGRLFLAGGDKAVDLAVAEQPPAILLDHPVDIAAAGADRGATSFPWRAVLHHSPVRPHLGLLALEADHDVGGQMHRARAVA